MDIQARLDEIKKERQAESIRAGQIQEELNRAVIKVHQLDGAIAALTEVLPKE